MSFAGTVINAVRSYNENRNQRLSQRRIKSDESILPPIELKFNTEPLTEKKKLEIALRLKKARKKNMLVNLVCFGISLAILIFFFKLFF